jgi:hypothetical protein
MYRLKLPKWTINVCLKMKGGGKIGLFWGWVPVGSRWAQERDNEGEYGGCILYPYMKIKE